MPRYDYECSCGAVFERRQPVAERATAACHLCGAPAPKRFSLPLLIEVPEHFRHLQSQFLPEKGSEKWADLATKADISQYHSPREGPSLKDHLSEEFGLTRERIVTSSG